MVFLCQVVNMFFFFCGKVRTFNMGVYGADTINNHLFFCYNFIRRFIKHSIFKKNWMFWQIYHSPTFNSLRAKNVPVTNIRRLEMKQKPKLELKLLIFLHFTFTLIVKWAGFNVATCTCLCSLGYLLADDPQGETPLIPSEVMEFSIKHSTEVDINTTLQILGSPGEKASSIPGCNRTDSVIRYCALFISCLFAFCFVFLS